MLLECMLHDLMAVYGLRPRAILKRLWSDIFKQYYRCIKQYQLSKNKVVVFRRKAMMQNYLPITRGKARFVIYFNVT